MQYIAYELVLDVIRNIIFVCDVFHFIWTVISYKLKILFNNDYRILQRENKHIDKLPNSVAILLNELERDDDYVISSAINVFSILSKYNIPNLIFYDLRGICMNNQDKLLHEFNKIEKSNNTIVSAERKIEFIDFNESYSTLPTVAKSICQEHNDAQGVDSDTTVANDSLVVKHYKKLYSKRNSPELAIVVGGTMSPFGFDPFLLSFTEFSMIRSSWFIHEAVIADIIDKITRTTQNYGK
ncbi:hypothetical protein GJ496_003338 [Pomphorhynchus laevis]|nr:hypothetical protein GJ496_003338 [Pomphorhynchus laevis]